MDAGRAHAWCLRAWPRPLGQRVAGDDGLVMLDSGDTPYGRDSCLAPVACVVCCCWVRVCVCYLLGVLAPRVSALEVKPHPYDVLYGSAVKRERNYILILTGSFIKRGHAVL